MRLTISWNTKLYNNRFSKLPVNIEPSAFGCSNEYVFQATGHSNCFTTITIKEKEGAFCFLSLISIMWFLQSYAVSNY